MEEGLEMEAALGLLSLKESSPSSSATPPTEASPSVPPATTGGEGDEEPLSLSSRRRTEAGGGTSSNFMAAFYRRQLQLSTSDFRLRAEAQRALACRRIPPSPQAASFSATTERRAPQALDAEAVSTTPRDMACFFRSATICLASPAENDLKEQRRLLRSDEANLHRQQQLLSALRRRAALARRGSLITARTQQLTLNQQTDALGPRQRPWLSPLRLLPSEAASPAAVSSPAFLAARVAHPLSAKASLGAGQTEAFCFSADTRRAGAVCLRRRERSEPSRGGRLWQRGASRRSQLRAAEAAALAAASHGGVRLPGDWRRERAVQIELKGLAAEAAARAAADAETAAGAARTFCFNAAAFASLRRTTSDSALQTRFLRAKAGGGAGLASSVPLSLQGRNGFCSSLENLPAGDAEGRLLSHASLTELMQQALEVSAAVESAAPEQAALVAEAVDSLVRALRLRVLQGRQRVELQLLLRQRTKKTETRPPLRRLASAGAAPQGESPTL